MAPKDDPALGERDVAAANGGDAADGIADAEAVREFFFFFLLSSPLAFLTAACGGLSYSSAFSVVSHPSPLQILQTFTNRSSRP